MSRDLLDAHLPGWERLPPIHVRWAVAEHPARLRPALRAAYDAAMAEPPAPLPAATVPPPAPPSRPRRARPAPE